VSGGLGSFAEVAAKDTVLNGAAVNVALHEALLPPLKPAQVHVHGPAPLRPLKLPAVQYGPLGAELNELPFGGEEQAPLTGEAVFAALHEAVVPPPEPAQVHVHGPAPLNALAVPALQYGPLGAELYEFPFGGAAHAPFTIGAALWLAEQLPLFAPPPVPLQIQLWLLPADGKLGLLETPCEHCRSLP
jgi:hypothetical protein